MNVNLTAIYNRLGKLVLGSDGSKDDNTMDTNSSESSRKNGLSPIDILVTQVMLTRGCKLPPDVVDSILDYAEYWAHSSNELDYLVEQKDVFRIVAQSNVEDRLLVRSYPVGLTGIKGNQDLSEELAWDTTEAQPLPLTKEHETGYFTNLVKYPTPRLVHPVRKIVFTIKSKDQGWGGDPEARGSYRASWTWFEAGLEKFDAEQKCDPLCTYDVRHKYQETTESPLPVCSLRPLYPKTEVDESQHKGETHKEGKRKEKDEDKETNYRYTHPLQPQSDWVIQRNRTATREWKEHVVTWHWRDDIDAQSDEARVLDEEHGRGRETLDGSFVRDLRIGDVITVWGKARFGGWVNHIERVKIDVYWAL